MGKYAMFEVYLAQNWPDVEAGKEVITEVLRLDDASIRLVKARIARKPEDLPDSDELWIRNDEGSWIATNPWRIKVTEELDPDEVEFVPAASAVKPIYGLR